MPKLTDIELVILSADAFVLTFAGGLDRVEDDDRGRRRRRRWRSWMAA